MKPGAASASAATASCGTFDGPDPNRPSRGRSASGIVIGDLGGGCAHRITLATGSASRRVPARRATASGRDRVALGGRVEQRGVPDRVTGRREAEQLELARRRALGELHPVERRRLRLVRRRSRSSRRRRGLNATARMKRAPSGAVTSTPRWNTSVRYASSEPRTPGAGRSAAYSSGSRFGITSGTVVARSPESRRGTRCVGALPSSHVGEVEERLEVPPRRLVRRRQPRVVPVGVHRLLVVGLAAVLRRRVDLVEPEVGRSAARARRSRRSRGCTHSRLSAPLPGNGKWPCQMCCSGRKPGPVAGHV